MGELDDNQQARLFDALLEDAERWRVAPRAQSRRAAELDDEVAEDLALVAALRDVTPGRGEVEFARSRVGQRLAEMMRTESAPSEAAWDDGARVAPWEVAAPPTTPMSRPYRSARAQRIWRQTQPAQTTRARIPLSRMIAGVAALLILAFGLLAGASVASAQALPESPLYAIKRAEETTLLALSWTDQSKGQTLMMIADHRITEAMAEAGLQHTTEARALLGEFNTALSQLIDLTAHANAAHEDSSSLTRAVQVTLEVEQNAAAQAAAQGETTFAQAAQTSAQAAVTHIQQAGIALPGQSGQSHGKGNGAGATSTSSATKTTGNGNGNGSGKPQHTPGPKATHTPHTNPGNGNGNGG